MLIAEHTTQIWLIYVSTENLHAKLPPEIMHVVLEIVFSLWLPLILILLMYTLEKPRLIDTIEIDYANQWPINVISGDLDVSIKAQITYQSTDWK